MPFAPAPHVRFHIFNGVAAYWELAAHSAYLMILLDTYLSVNLVFSHLGFWCGNLFLISQFPDHCLILSFSSVKLGLQEYVTFLFLFQYIDCWYSDGFT